MINILLNINNFAESFAFEKLKDFLKPSHRVLIFPFAYHEDYIQTEQDYDAHFLKGCSEIEEIIQEFSRYGISRKNIKIAHYYRDTRKSLKSKIYHSDILFFTGGYPDRILYRLDKLNIRKFIQKFSGIVMGTSAGAMIQLDKYHVTPECDTEIYDFQFGLGLISGFDIEVHFEPTDVHLESMARALSEHDVPIYALPNDTGLLITEDKQLHLLGNPEKYLPE